MRRKLIVPMEVDEIDNPHLAVAREKFPIGWDDAVLPEVQFLFLCLTNRCGSNYLAEALASDGRLNVAGEYFNADTMRDEPFGAMNFCDYVRGLTIQEGKNGYLVTKVAITQLKMLAVFDILPAILPKSRFILIRRTDILGQAISLDIAWQNKQWVSSAKPQISDNELVFSAERISAILRDIIRQNALFDYFFAANDLLPFAVNYEQFTRRPELGLETISSWLELVPPIQYDLSAISVRRQSRDINWEWRKRFLAEVRGD